MKKSEYISPALEEEKFISENGFAASPSYNRTEGTEYITVGEPSNIG